MSQAPRALITAWQRVLAGEHACVYAYEMIGGRLPAGTAPQQRAAAAYRHHRARRDALTARLHAVGATPVSADPAYALPTPVNDEKQATKVAVHVETRCTTLYAQVVAAATGTQRTDALDAMTWCATQLLAWGGHSSALPGVRRP